MKDLNFKLSINRRPVILEDHEGKSINLELRELSAASRDRYMDRLTERMRIGPDGKPAGLKRYEGLKADLLSQALFDEKGENVPQTTIQTWPANVVGMLFDAAQEMNHLDKEEAKKEGEPAKND